MEKLNKHGNGVCSQSQGETAGDLGIIEFKRNRVADFICMKIGNDGYYSDDTITLVAAGTVDNLITVWDLDSAQVLLSLPGHTSHIHVLDFTQDDLFLLSGSADETVMIWSLESLHTLAEHSSLGTQNLTALSLGPVVDVKFLALSQDYTGDELLQKDKNRDYTDEHNNKDERERNVSARMVAPDDGNCLRILDDGSPVFRSPSEEGNTIR